MLNIKMNKPKNSFQILEKSAPPEKQTQQLDPQEPSQASSSISSSLMSEASHFDDLIAATEDIPVEETPNPTSTKLTEEQFRQSFIGLHSMASSVSGISALALPNTHINERTAHEVADTLYESILDVPMLHFLLEPGNKWIGRALVMAIYVQGMHSALKHEKASKRRTHKEQRSTQGPPQNTHSSSDLSPDQIAALTGSAS